MANVIDILIKANTSQASGAMGQFKSGLDQVVRGLTGFSTAGIGVAAGIVAIGNEIKKAVNEYSDYATAIGKAAELSGITAEEMSRLAQAADDVFVSQEALTRSFQMGLKNGFVPTIENLAVLSDELLAMENPAERAEKASEIFGRQWADIAPFILQGGDAIREGTAAIEDGLIVTDESVAQNIEYKEALDELNDTFQALSYTAGKTLVPALTSVLGVMTNLISIYDRTTVTTENMEEALLRVPPAYREIERAKIEQLIIGRELLTLTSESTEGIAGYSGALENTAAVLSNTTGATEAARGAIASYNLALSGVAQLNQDIAGAQQNLADAQAAWNQGAGADAKSLLDESALGAEDYYDALGVLDQVYGTSEQTQYNYNKRLEEANAEYAKSKDLEAYQKALEGIKDEFSPLDKKIKDATASLDELTGKLDALNGRVIDVTINVQQTNGVTLPPGAPQVPVYTPPAGGGGSSGGGGYVPPSTPLPPGTIPMPPGSTTIIVDNKVDSSRAAANVVDAITRRR